MLGRPCELTWEFNYHYNCFFIKTKQWIYNEIAKCIVFDKVYYSFLPLEMGISL